MTTVTITLTDDDVAYVDSRRGPVSRTVWTQLLLNHALSQQQRGPLGFPSC
jgi:hypothetical protein